MKRTNKILLGYVLSAAGGVAASKIQGQSWSDAAKNGIITGGLVGSGVAALILATDNVQSSQKMTMIRKPSARRNPEGTGKTGAKAVKLLTEVNPDLLSDYTGDTFDVAATPANPHEINVRE